MDDAANFIERPAAPGEEASAAPPAASRASPPAAAAGATDRAAPPSLFDRLGHLLGLDAPIRRWMLADRLAAMTRLGIPAGEVLARLGETAESDAEHDMIMRAIDGHDANGVAGALAAVGGYAPRDLAALCNAPGEAAALARLATALRRRLTLRYSAALAAAALTLILAVGIVRHRLAEGSRAVAVAVPAHVASPARPAPLAPDLAPALGPGLAGAPPPLVGIVGRLPDDAVALIRMPNGRTRMLAVGAVFDGWTLASLGSDEAVFTRSGQRVTVTLPPADDQ